MTIIFGSGFYGKIAEHKSQWIETKFYHLFFIPVIPAGSMLVTSSGFRSRQGLEIASHKKSIIAAYCRLFSVLMALLMFYLAFTPGYFVPVEQQRYELIKYLLLGLIFTASAIYFFFYYGKATPEDILVREKIGSATGIYALPNWFDFFQSKSKLDTLLHGYIMRYPGQDWKKDVMDHNIETARRPLLFAIALFSCMVYDIPEYDELYYKADALYQPQATEPAYFSK